MKHSKQWARRGAFAKGSRRLHERFVKTSRALKASRRDREAFAKPCEGFSNASPIPTEASWSLVEGHARHSWRLHLKTIRQIMTSPLHLRILLRIIVDQRKRRDYRMTSYDPALEISAFESNGPTLRTRRRLWAGHTSNKLYREDRAGRTKSRLMAYRATSRCWV